MNFSLVSKQAYDMTLASVTRPGLPPVRKLMEEIGYENTLHHITKLLIDADLALGGDGDFHRCQTSAATVMLNTQHRSFGFIALAVREGLANAANGKAYGRINTQLVNEWTSAQEAKITGMAESEHAKYTVRGDNYDSRWLDKQERDATMKDRKIATMGRVIDDLKSKLNTEKP